MRQSSLKIWARTFFEMRRHDPFIIFDSQLQLMQLQLILLVLLDIRKAIDPSSDPFDEDPPAPWSTVSLVGIDDHIHRWDIEQRWRREADELDAADILRDPEPDGAV